MKDLDMLKKIRSLKIDFKAVWTLQANAKVEMQR